MTKFQSLEICAPQTSSHWKVWAAALLVSGSVFAQPLYTVTDLGTLGGGSSRARAVNEDGFVVGESETKTGVLHAFLWTAKAGMKDLGTLGGALSRANAINDRGIIVGEAEDKNGTSQPVRWLGDAAVTNLPLPADANGGVALAINHFGTIVGIAETDVGSIGVRWEKGEVEIFFTNGLSATPHGVNETDVLAGRLASTNQAGEPIGLAFTLAADHREPRTYEPRGGTALSINRSGVAAGYAEFSAGVLHAARFDEAGATDIDTLNNTHSSANAINDRGEVVGMFVRGAGDEDRAFLVQAGRMYDLNDLIDSAEEWTLLEATGINSRGQICGHGLKGGKERAFLLTPKPGTHAPDISVTILSPTNGAGIRQSAEVQITASAVASDGVKRVTYLVAGEVIGSATNAPYAIEWKALRAGDYDLFAIVTNMQGDSRKSARVRLRIEPKP